MGAYSLSLSVSLLVFAFLGAGVWIFAGVLLVSVSSLLILLDFPIDRIAVLAKTAMFRSSTGWELSALPLFIWMGEIVFRTDVAERLFRGLSPLANCVPGRLLHTNVSGCTLFGAVCGSSAATAATVGKITTKALAQRGYDVDLTIGSLAAAGSLGLLIPPSIVMIVYGVIAEVSIAKLFIAGFVPGFIIAGVFSCFIAVRCWLKPSLSPAEEISLGVGEAARAMLGLWPVLLLIIVVMGSIYTGIATPTEAAAVGVGATFAIAALTRQLSWGLAQESALAAVRSSCMILSIMISASLLSTTLAYLHIPNDLAHVVQQSGLGPYQLIIAIGVLYLVLGCFLDGVSITVMTMPVVLPLITAAGFDPLWFGVFLVIMVELGQITPPVGFNLFVLQGLTGQPLSRVAKASAPFGILMLACLAVLTIWPGIVMWLPNLLQP
ncbi:TRAP transporter large permease subunit [Xanthobacter dioxanivorans]|uniref:TRAP transporter large permease protein n=1 Tax=Xanthobacter dioxanivorans TaxID=2528964 RepID=A0A974PT97_9HYPH|nr:TRAP transporter large permease subunit [Xanthobacter dioxanivorans]QRG08690.1 TRAP transporter large permease subunit [Xanthobacter dioxanivorans]